MKKQILFFTLLAATSLVTASDNNCGKIQTLITKAKAGQMEQVGNGQKFKTSDDFEAAIASITLDGATKCYVQDAIAAKMYVAEFGKVSGEATDAVLVKKYNDLANMFKNCLGSTFASKEGKTSKYLLKHIEFDGRSANKNVKIILSLIYNPGDSKQLLYVSLVNDPD